MPKPILIVDDEPGNLATLKHILGAEHALVFARNGADCLAAVRKHQPALVLLDVQMPDMDGYAVCRALKAESTTENIPVIFVSALSEVGDEAAGFNSGGVDYIIKPVSPALVKARVRTHLSLVRAKQLEIEQAKTARLSRIHAILSCTNSAIVRIRESAPLLEQACRIAVEQGGFAIAWAAMFSERQAFDFVTCVGLHAEMFASELNLKYEIWRNDSSLGHVLSSGQMMFSNDVRLEPETAPLCKHAEKCNCLSAVGMPLVVSDKIVGAMFLYSYQANQFDAEELKLLSELSGDISLALQSMEHEKQARFLSYYDALTGLPNITLFLDRLGFMLKTAQQENVSVCVAELNLNRFKQINDARGRHVGDHVLRFVAKRLEACFPQPYCLARANADNFILAGTISGSQDARILCDRLSTSAAEPFVVDGQEIQLSPRLGIAIFPTDAEDAEQLFKNAEAALKQCKASKLHYAFYSTEFNTRVSEHLELEAMLKVALREHQFVLYYQPKVNVITGHIVGAEALIRWEHPQRGLIPPNEFIPFSEETGLIVSISEWVIEAACTQQAVWLAAGLAAVPVALNLSALHFRESVVLETVLCALEASQLGPEWIELELTESVVMHNPVETEATMRALRKHGLRLSLDDFGTGYSSLAYLKRFPFDSVKIDRAFIVDIARNPDDAAIASAIIAMAHNLRMHVIAEGVETEAQLRFLQLKSCDLIQGYYFSAPVPAIEFETMLREDKCMTLPARMDAP
ncbi:MAG: EAL domain-containing protein [Burkholderiaceae bacterium]|nr:EAL domain-containing protein [Burkholderiaceae bacterium]